jgi:hypothetical protein
MWQKRRKTLLIIAGALYVLFGILAFFDIPGGHDQHHHTFAHNLTHIILGCVLLAVTVRFPPRARRRLCLGFAAAYAVIASFGLTMGKHTTLKVVPGMIEFHAGDYAVHFATALFFLFVGLLRRSDTASPTREQPAQDAS